MSDSDKYVVKQYELDNLEAIRLELHEIGAHNPQISQMILSLTSKLWPIIHKKRERVND